MQRAVQGPTSNQDNPGSLTKEKERKERAQVDVMRRAKVARWIVADMDKTLVDKQPGTYPAFSDSPAFQPILKWLSLGGKLLCVTSDDGYRPFRQFWADIPKGHRENGQVLLSTAGGATLFTGDGDGEAVKVTSFFDEVRGGLPQPRQATRIATKMLSDFFLDAFDDLSILKPLDERRRLAYETILKKCKSKNELENLLTENNMVQPGKFLERGSLIWRNQAGPVNSWIKQKDVEKNWENVFFTNLFVLGLPDSISSPYIEKYSKSLEVLGIKASAAPNSVCLSNNTIDKGTVIRWMNDCNEFDFTYKNCIAIGDSPEGNDYALTTFQHVGMPFVNCGDKPTHHDTYYVGEYEFGVSKFIRYLNEVVETANNNGYNVSCGSIEDFNMQTIFAKHHLVNAIKSSRNSKL